jgi:hypothetical protein
MTPTDVADDPCAQQRDTENLQSDQNIDPQFRPPTHHYHQFHATAHALSGHVRAPINQRIERHVPIELNDERGGHLTRFTDDVSIEGLISVKKARTRVSGSASPKHQAWVTLSTTVLEGLNVFEVITADRVVGQVSTEHAFDNGHIPTVTFLGTRFENLRVCGVEVNVTYKFDVCGDKPDGDKDSYLTKKGFLEATQSKVQKIVQSGFLFGEAAKQYDRRLEDITRLMKEGKGCSITCSLVESIDIKKVQERIPKARTVGHVIVIPDFGAVSLGEVRVGVEQPTPGRSSRSMNGNPQASNYFELTMLNMELGCVGNASVQVGKNKSNGTTNP